MAWTGRIIAESVRDACAGAALGATLDSGTLQQVLDLRTAQDYHVTPFAPSPLYGGRHAWIYHAAVRDPAATASVVGGIGLVFDADAELGAMLRDGLGQAGGEAYFIDRQGRVLASTVAARPAGTLLKMDRDLLDMARGGSSARLAVHEGQYAMLGCCAARGYREFKTSDGYRDDVMAVVLRCHGELRRTAAPAAAAATASGASAGARRYATFLVGGELHAIAAEDVQEAYPASAVAPVSAGAMPVHCGMLALRDGKDIASYIWVADLGHMLGLEPAAGQGGQVVVRHGEHAVGVLVEALDTVMAFADEDIAAAPLAREGDSALVRRVIRGSAQLLPLVDAGGLRRMLGSARDE
ncbi:MAG: chemotaxis protein CheW [Noviherbaspirillum sp.]